MGKDSKQWHVLFSWGPKSLRTVTAAMKLTDACSLEEKLWWQCIKKQKHHFANKGLPSQSCGFSSSHVWMWELNHKEDSVPKNWWFRNVVLEKTLESPLGSKEIKPVNPKGNQSWIFIGRTDAEDDTPTLWPHDAKSRLMGKTLKLGKIKGRGEGAERGWDGWMASAPNGHETEQTTGDSDGQGRPACSSPWGHKESDTTEQLNNSNIYICWCVDDMNT